MTLRETGVSLTDTEETPMDRNPSSETTSTRRIPWNKDHLIGPKPPLKLREIWAIRNRLQLTGRVLELA